MSTETENFTRVTAVPVLRSTSMFVASAPTTVLPTTGGWSTFTDLGFLG